MKKNTAAIILTILITLLTISCNNESPAVTSYRDGGVLYQLDGNEMVASFDKNAYPENNTEIIIKANCKGYPVTSIAPSGFKGKDFITSVSFEDGSNITAIGDEAFKGCSGLISITIPDSVDTIGIDAFKNCAEKLHAFIPKGKYKAFKPSFDETACLFEDKVIDYLFYFRDSSQNSLSVSLAEGASCPDTIAIKANINGIPVTKIADHAFEGCEGLSKVQFEAGNEVTIIGASAFKGCSGLTDFEFSTIPALKVIGESAFENCSSFTYAELKYQDLTIGNKAFDGIADLTVLVPENMAETYKPCFPTDTNIYEDIHFIEDGVEYLFSKKDKCFVVKAADDIASYNEITIRSQIKSYDVKKIADSAFYEITTLETVNFDEENPRLEIIGSKAFYNCTSLSSISLPSSLISIETSSDYDAWDEGVFANTAISGVNCPDGLEVIPEYCFYGCSKLNTVNLNKVQTIGNSAFLNTDSLTLLIIPASVTEIDEYAFQNENKGGLEKLGFLGTELPHIGNSAFDSFRKMEIYVKSHLIESVEEMEGQFGISFEVSDIDETVFGDSNNIY